MCIYIPQFYIFLVAINNKVKIWNALTGDIKKIYSNLTEGEITAFSVDELGKRFLLGSSNGYIAVHNVFNGALLKSIREDN